ncbi:MAG: hypothetical protein AVDCRST_MAG19-1031, partial [uncultured Thermomicrobiales bacterium]
APSSARRAGQARPGGARRGSPAAGRGFQGRHPRPRHRRRPNHAPLHPAEHGSADHRPATLVVGM